MAPVPADRAGELRADDLRAGGLAAAESVEPLVFNPNNAVTGAVERLRLTDGTSVVRKVLRGDAPATVSHWAAGANPTHWNHWRREADAYDSGAVRAFEPHVRAPQLLARVSSRPGREVLFLEDVDGPSGFDLRAEHLVTAAGALGRAQGAPATAQWPGFHSASREGMWAYSCSRPPGPGGYLDARSWEHPVVVEGFGEQRHELRRRFGELLGELWWWRRVSAACPRTFCHLDFWSPNLIVDNAGPVLVDWAFCGVAAVGEDAGNLVPDVMLDHQFAPEDYDTFDRAVWRSYADGLVAAGWTHPPELARLASCATVARYAWLPAAMVANADHVGPTGYAGRDGLALVEVFTRRRSVLLSMLERLDEARALVAETGLAG